MCDSARPLDWADACVRVSWAALSPAVLVTAICIGSRIPLPAPLRPFLTLQEAEALDAEDKTEDNVNGETGASLWRTVLLAFVALAQALLWFAAGAYKAITDKQIMWIAMCAFLIGASWLYGIYKPVFYPKPTAHLDLFTLYAVHLTFAVVLLGGALYDHKLLYVPLPPRYQLAGLIVNLASVLVELGVVCTMPFELPSNRFKKEDIVSRNGHWLG